MLVLPYLDVLLYLILRGHVRDRNITGAKAQEAEFRSCMRKAAGPDSGGRQRACERAGQARRHERNGDLSLEE